MKASSTFEDLCRVVTEDLPRLVDADGGTVYQMLNHRKVEVVLGECRPEERSSEGLHKLNAILPLHPLIPRFETTLAANLGVAVSRQMDPEEYRKSSFVRQLCPDDPICDSMLGELFSWCHRSAILSLSRKDAPFSDEDIERFKIIVYAARSICERIAGRNVEREVHNFFMTQSGGGPVTAFIMSHDGSVMPVNYEALRFTEKYWSQDEPFRHLPETERARIMSRVESSWQDPLRARFQPIDLDMGAGTSNFYVLPNALMQLYIFTVGQTHSEQSRDRLKSVLTDRQCEIMEWIAEGKTSWEVATILGISPRTVEKHMEAVFQRLNVENRVAAARRYLDLKSGAPV